MIFLLSILTSSFNLISTADLERSKVPLLFFLVRAFPRAFSSVSGVVSLQITSSRVPHSFDFFSFLAEVLLSYLDKSPKLAAFLYISSSSASSSASGTGLFCISLSVSDSELRLFTGRFSKRCLRASAAASVLSRALFT
ncbi:hypothetical protein PUN28_013817 [Cardiocondyla obscurior]|uniref:Secreted protein n=1 Tax=Cardiocondyla obscurior TaxID=286306 RepID=A0AAW2F7C5_9HYME